MVTAHSKIHYSVFLTASLLFLSLNWRLKSISKKQLTAIALMIVIGIFVDFLLASFQLIQFSNSTTLPIWLVCLWIWFGVTFFTCYQWMQKLNLAFVLVIGGIFGPIAYWGASLISSIIILSPIGFTLISGAFWGGLFVTAIKYCLPNNQ